ncbi:MAG: thioesterase family protein [Mycolicibacterium hassiacum]|nr:MAG: acyl-CoA thioesterase II [Mycolicibacterium hassiacum]
MSADDHSVAPVEHSGPLQGPLAAATLRALDTLEQVLELEPTGPDRFRAGSEPNRFGRIFGGQLLAQAMTAAAATVPEHRPSGIHALFVRGGDETVPVDLIVERTRDGRTMSTRRVGVQQAGRTVLTAMVSFAEPGPDADADDGPVTAPEVDPESIPLLQDWLHTAPPELLRIGRVWTDVPPAVEMRIAEAPIFFGGDQKPGERTLWMRLPRTVADRPGLHEVLLTYASDYLLVDMAFRNHPEPLAVGAYSGVTVDHAVWLHRPVRFDQWLGHVTRTVGFGGNRALVQGRIIDAAGRHVASTAQEVLIRAR